MLKTLVSTAVKVGLDKINANHAEFAVGKDFHDVTHALKEKREMARSDNRIVEWRMEGESLKIITLLMASNNFREVLRKKFAMNVAVLENRVRIGKEEHDVTFHASDLGWHYEEIPNYLFIKFRKEMDALVIMRSRIQDDVCMNTLLSVTHLSNIATIFASDLFRSCIETEFDHVSFGLPGVIRFGRTAQDANITLQEEVECLRKQL